MSLRTLWPIEQVKSFLEIKDNAHLCAFDYCKMRKRSDLAVVLGEFVDTSKSVLDISFTYVEDFDFKAVAKTQFAKEIDLITRLDTSVQYSPR